MKLSALLVALTTSTLCFAQESKLKNELGVMADVNISSGSNNSFNMGGLQYKHWKNNHFAGRFSIALGSYNDVGPESYLYSGTPDTVLSRKVNYLLPMVHVAVGFEYQKQFYKKLYFYGGMELAVGFGSGYSDTAYVKTEVSNLNKPLDIITYGKQSVSSNGTYASFSPLFGLKLNLKRWVIGTEFSDPVTFLSRTDGAAKVANINFAFGNLNQRFYINYRFK